MSAPVLLVTGASRGIGAETAQLAAARGWRVAINYASRADAAEAVVREIVAAGGEAVALRGDVSSGKDVESLFAEIDARFGRLDGLVNNAGVVGRKARLDEMDLARFERMFAVNVIGSLLCAREAVKRMSSTHGGKGGVIVNISSVAAKLGSPFEYVDYAAAKGAIDSFTIGLAKEVANEGIRVNAVRPGIIDTEIHASGGQPDRVERIAPLVPLRRAGTAREVAETILFLLSDAASYMTGAIVDVAGGR